MTKISKPSEINGTFREYQEDHLLDAMDCVRVVLVFYLFGIVSTKSTHDERRERLFRFGYSHTKTVIQPYTITSVVPSSCIHVESTLPRCRNVRYFGFGSSNSENTTNSTSIIEDEIQTTPLSWGEYFGLSAPTVMVTFSLKGCRPQRVPLGLDRCQIQPTPTALPIVPTSTVNAGSIVQDTNQLIGGNNNQLQGSQADIQPAPSNAPTTTLDSANST
ncbi:hypothetical protein Trydic_g16854 [Trypoxylus dichotomus]